MLVVFFLFFRQKPAYELRISAWSSDVCSSDLSVQRLIELFPPIDQGQVRHALGSTLRGIVNQRLLERADGRGRIPAVEVLVGTGKVAEAVADPAHQTPLEIGRAHV